MRKMLLITFSIIMILCFSITSFADQDAEGIKIKLQKDGSAEVIDGDKPYSIDYIRIDDRILAGRGHYDDLLYLLSRASDISGQKYNLVIKHHTGFTFKSYDVVITASDGAGNIRKTLEFDSTTKDIGDGLAIIGTGYSEGQPPYYLDNNGEYVYFLPLRYIFEQLGFSVNYEKAGDKETISIYE